MGDIVNTASRIEGLNKHLGTRVLVSAEVVDQLGGLLMRELGSFRLKGKTRPIVIHEMICRLSEADVKQKEAFGFFAEGLHAFKEKSWDDAIEKFRLSLDTLGEDEPSRFYIGLCERHKANPPEATWDGVVHMDKK
jgi:adenylate cyclase